MTNADFIPVCEPLLAGNEEKYVLEAVRSGWISSAGEFITRFEEGFAAYCGRKHGIAVSSGTAAIHVALLAAGIGKDDEVIIPDFTMAGTLFPILAVGATPVFVDIEEDTWNIDPAKIEEKITPRTKAIIPVHIYGHPVSMDPILDLARRRGIFVIEDAAEAHGAEDHGRKCGGMGDIGAFSFFANKIITTGEGGMIVTDDDRVARQARYFRNMCFPPDAPRAYEHADLGWNFRMTNLQAAVGLAQLERLDDYADMRRRNAARYTELLADVPGIRTPIERPGFRNVHWMYGIAVEAEKFGCERDELMTRLRTRGIDTRASFQPMHSQPVLAKFGIQDAGSYPVTERAAAMGMYLPSSSGLTDEQIVRVATAVREIHVELTP